MRSSASRPRSSWRPSRPSGAQAGSAIIAAGNTQVAEAEGRIVAFVDAVPGEVTRLFLLPETAGRGLGARLLALGIAAARRDHPGPIRVESTLNAERFYLRHGFRTVGRSLFSHGSSHVPLDIVLMELELPANR